MLVKSKYEILKALWMYNFNGLNMPVRLPFSHIAPLLFELNEENCVCS